MRIRAWRAPGVQPRSAHADLRSARPRGSVHKTRADGHPRARHRPGGLFLEPGDIAILEGIVSQDAGSPDLRLPALGKYTTRAIRPKSPAHVAASVRREQLQTCQPKVCVGELAKGS